MTAAQQITGKRITIDQLAAMVAEGFNSILEQMATKDDIKRIELRMDRLEERMTRLEERMDLLEARMDNLEKRMDALEVRIESLETRMGSLENRATGLEKNTASIYDELYEIKIHTSKLAYSSEVIDLKERVYTIEQKIEVIEKDQ